jgi:hypothetical protein
VGQKFGLDQERYDRDPDYRFRYDYAKKRAYQWVRIFARAREHVDQGLNLYGRLSKKQLEALRPHVKGRHVHDLGAGNLEMAKALLRLGAKRVTAIDKAEAVTTNPRIEVVKAYFHDLGDLTPDVAFVSWPVNHDQPGLFRVLRAATKVIYLGKNSDGTSCGHPTLFRDLLNRELLTYVPERENTLIVGGQTLMVPREPTGEERANFSTSTILQYDEVEKCGSTKGL